MILATLEAPRIHIPSTNVMIGDTRRKRALQQLVVRKRRCASTPSEKVLTWIPFSRTIVLICFDSELLFYTMGRSSPP